MSQVYYGAAAACLVVAEYPEHLQASAEPDWDVVNLNELAEVDDDVDCGDTDEYLQEAARWKHDLDLKYRMTSAHHVVSECVGVSCPTLLVINKSDRMDPETQMLMEQVGYAKYRNFCRKHEFQGFVFVRSWNDASGKGENIDAALIALLQALNRRRVAWIQHHDPNMTAAPARPSGYPLIQIPKLQELVRQPKEPHSSSAQRAARAAWRLFQVPVEYGVAAASAGHDGVRVVLGTTANVAKDVILRLFWHVPQYTVPTPGEELPPSQ